MAYKRKTMDEWRFWINYGGGWEHETTEQSRKAAKAQQKTYRENVPEYPTKITGPHRVPIDPLAWVDDPSQAAILDRAVAQLFSP